MIGWTNGMCIPMKSRGFEPQRHAQRLYSSQYSCWISGSVTSCMMSSTYTCEPRPELVLSQLSLITPFTHSGRLGDMYATGASQFVGVNGTNCFMIVCINKCEWLALHQLASVDLIRCSHHNTEVLSFQGSNVCGWLRFLVTLESGCNWMRSSDWLTSQLDLCHPITQYSLDCVEWSGEARKLNTL